MAEGTNTLVRDALAAMPAPVVLHLFTDRRTAGASAEARRLLAELVPLADRLALEEHDAAADPAAAARFGIARTPAVAVVGDRDRGVRVYGAPGGYEFLTLVDTILLVSAGDSGLSAASRARLAGLTAPVDVKVFVTATCASCPRMVSLAHRAAIESDLVTASSIVATEFPDLVKEYKVTGVPKTVVGDRTEIYGVVEEEELIKTIVEC